MSEMKNVRLLLASFVLATYGFACTGRPHEKVLKFTQCVQNIISDSHYTTEGKISRIKNAMKGNVSMEQFARQAVGRTYWIKATDEQKKALVDGIFDDLVHDYTDMFLNNAVKDPRLKQYRKLTNATSSQSIQVVYTNNIGKDMVVSYAVYCNKNTDDTWQIYDLSVNDMALTKVQQNVYKSKLEQGGVQGLIDYLSSGKKSS